MRTALIRLIEGLGLQPDALLDDWKIVGQAVKTWLESGHLTAVTIEFYVPGASVASARWDIPVAYDGNGVADDMWLDRDHLARTIAKSTLPPANAKYRLVLSAEAGRAEIAAMGPAELRSVSAMLGRSAGTIIASPAITAGLTYWKSRT